MMLILPSQAMVKHHSVHPASFLFSSDSDKIEIEVHSHKKPLVYPEGVIVLCSTNTFELHSNEDPSSKIQSVCNFVDLHLLIS